MDSMSNGSLFVVQDGVDAVFVRMAHIGRQIVQGKRLTEIDFGRDSIEPRDKVRLMVAASRMLDLAPIMGVDPDEASADELVPQSMLSKMIN